MSGYTRNTNDNHGQNLLCKTQKKLSLINLSLTIFTRSGSGTRKILDFLAETQKVPETRKLPENQYPPS